MSRLSLSCPLVLLLGLGASALAGCGESAAPPGVTMRPSDRDGGDGDGDGDGGDGDAGDDAGVMADPLAPVVEVVAPEPARDPNEDEVLVSDEVTVTCKISKSDEEDAREVDAMSIKIVRESAEEGEEPVAVEGIVKPGASADHFEATFALADVGNGPATFRCTASDVGEPAKIGTAVLRTLVDRGPKITFIEPVDQAVFPLGQVSVKFRVEPDPLTDGDDEAEVDDVAFTVLGRDDFAPVEDPEEQGLYTATVDFTRDDVFTMPPSNASLVVSATNRRSPVPAERSERVNITIDSDPPDIDVVKPDDLAIVRGEVTLELMITDPSGIDARSVKAALEPTDIVLTDWEVMGNKFTASFDTRDVMFTQLVQLTINIEARDMAGNGVEVGIALRLDNFAPLVSLDPPLIREWKMGDAEHPYYCSTAFDPLGDAVGDLGRSEESSLYRALVYDRTNTTPGVVVNYASGVDDESVGIYAQGDPAIPLLIDTNGDGKCDEIAIEQDDDDDEPVLLRLSPMATRGSAYFSTSIDDPGNVAESFCDALEGDAPTPPMPLCLATGMTRLIHGPQSGNPPAIYGFAPDNVACTGNAWANLLSIVGEGWACLAGRAEDKIGNVGVSPPIRVCFDDGEGTPACDPADTASAPSCVDDCTLPDDLPMDQTFRQ